MKVVYRLAALLALAAVGSCDGGWSHEPPLRLAYQREMITLDPHAHEDTMTRAILGSVYEGLVRFERGVGVQPAVAARWTTPDDTTWRFWLRSDLRFHDGRMVTVEDVLRSLERARTDPASRVATYLAMVASVGRVADDPSALEIVTSGPQPLLLPRLAQIAIAPFDMDPSRPIGTGPYRWVSGDIGGPVKLARWEGYWGEPAPASEVELIFVAHAGGVRELVTGGIVDAVVSTLEAELDGWSLPEGWSTELIESDATYLLGLNLELAPFDDARVREAIDLAIDREALCRAAFPRGTASPARSLVPPGVFGFDPEIVSTAPDPERARELLRQAGATGRHLRLEHGGADATVLEFLSDAVGAVGLDVEVVELPYRELLERSDAGLSPAFVFGWNFDFSDASSLLDALLHSPSPQRSLGLQNGSRFSDPSVDRWIEDIAVTVDAGDRLLRIQWALAAAREARPYLPLYHRSRLVLTRDGVSVDPRIDALARPHEVHWAR